MTHPDGTLCPTYNPQCPHASCRAAYAAAARATDPAAKTADFWRDVDAMFTRQDAFHARYKRMTPQEKAGVIQRQMREVREEEKRRAHRAEQRKAVRDERQAAVNAAEMAAHRAATCPGCFTVRAASGECLC